MSYGIFRIEKRQIGAVKGIELENNRSADHPINLPRSNVHWELTKYNEKIIYSPDFVESINKELDKYGLKARKNSVVMVDAYYGASPEYFESHSKEEWHQYFLDCVEFHQREFGHIINAVIHVDEDGGNHLHVVSVPVLDRGGGRFSLSARDLLGEKTDFHKRQDRFYEEVSSRYDLERGEIREDGARRKHLDTLDYKKQQREIEIQQREEQIEKQQETIETKRAEISEAEGIKAKLEEEIGKLDAIREAVKPLPFSVHQLFHYLGESVHQATERLYHKIERMEKVFFTDLRAAFCRMREIGHKLFTPETIGKRELFRTGNKPLYRLDYMGYRPTGIEKIDGKRTLDVSQEEWLETFSYYHEREEINPQYELEREITGRIETIRDIVIEKRTEIDQLREDDEIEVRYKDGEFIPVDRPEPEDEPDYYEQIEKDQQHNTTEKPEEPDEDEQDDTENEPPELF